ncbi:D-sedoheptulose 7-phosphate isomerase [Anaerotaenia torta]|uniref:D-sedoheptulose-7-phosphate isomerase n=1 Tax=Anaerotaenia torta TaxID=433293 RepID=UPI003D1A12CE
MKPEEILDELLEHYPKLAACKEEIHRTFEAWISCFDKKGKLMICGNGGSEADSQHIVGELMKEFYKKRGMDEAFAARLDGMFPGNKIASKLQSPLTAISLGINQVLTSAYSNDVAPEMIFAQEVYGYARENDILLALSTSGNSGNIVNAIQVAKAMNVKCIGICGAGDGTKSSRLTQLCDICIVIPERETYLVQELTLPVYHALCRMAEAYYW